MSKRLKHWRVESIWALGLFYLFDLLCLCIFVSCLFHRFILGRSPLRPSVSVHNVRADWLEAIKRFLLIGKAEMAWRLPLRVKRMEEKVMCVEEGNVGWLLWCRAHHQLIVCVCRGMRIKESTTPSRWISSLIKIPILKRLLLVILPLSQEIIIVKKILFKRYFTLSLGRINPSIEMQPQTILIKSTVHSFLYFFIFLILTPTDGSLDDEKT
jgi:hypothetical protein